MLRPKASKKTLKKTMKKNNTLKKVIFFNISIINKTFSSIYNTQIEKSFDMIFSCTLRGALDTEQVLEIIKLVHDVLWRKNVLRKPYMQNLNFPKVINFTLL